MVYGGLNWFMILKQLSDLLNCKRCVIDKNDMMERNRHVGRVE